MFIFSLGPPTFFCRPVWHSNVKPKDEYCYTVCFSRNCISLRQMIAINARKIYFFVKFSFDSEATDFSIESLRLQQYFQHVQRSFSARLLLVFNFVSILNQNNHKRTYLIKFYNLPYNCSGIAWAFNQVMKW